MSTICSICQEEYGDNDKSEKAPKVLGCGHTFCSKCILDNKIKNNNKIICNVDGIEDTREFDKIPFNKAMYEIIMEKKETTGMNVPVPIHSEKVKVKLNIGLIGDQCAGKTSISSCFTKNEVLKENNYKPTIGLGFFYKVVNYKNEQVGVKIWDTTGQEKYNSITSGYLRGLHGCFIVYDITDKNSFDNLDIWIQFYNNFNQYNQKIMIIIGNKSDMKNERQVQKKDGQRYAESRGLSFYETSCISLQGINEAFNEMVDLIMESIKINDISDKKGLKLTKTKVEEPRSGCPC